MISFEKPNKLNGGKLIEELLASGIEVVSDERYPFGVKAPELDGNDLLWLAIKSSDKNKAQAVLDAHNG